MYCDIRKYEKSLLESQGHSYQGCTRGEFSVSCLSSFRYRKKIMRYTLYKKEFISKDQY